MRFIDFTTFTYKNLSWKNGSTDVEGLDKVPALGTARSMAGARYCKMQYMDWIGDI